MRRAGLDYRELMDIEIFDNYQDLVDKKQPQRLFACTTKATHHYHEVSYQDNDYLLFGPETRGLPQNILDQQPQHYKIRIPMCAESRSLNLSNATAIILFEAWRQLGFAGSTIK